MISNHAKVLLTVIACALVAAEWTKEMDHFRKANCGLRELPKSDKNEGTVVLTDEDPLVQVTTKDTNGELVKAHAAGGTYVSRRHIITSAQAVLTEDKKWLFDGEAFNESMCNAEKHLIVPERYREQIVLRSGRCYTGACSYAHKTLTKAIILFMCTPDKEKFNEDRATMVLEFSQDMSEQFVCIADKGVRQNTGDITFTYGFQYKKDDFVNTELIYRNITITYFSTSHSECFILYAKIYGLGDRGGPMLFFQDSRWWLVGVAGTNGLYNHDYDTYNFRVQNYQDPLCLLFALCGRTNATDKLPDPFKITKAPTTTKSRPTTTRAPNVREPIAKKPPVAQASIAGVISNTFWAFVVLVPHFLFFNF